MSVGELAIKGFEVVHIQRRISSIYTAIVASNGAAPLDDRMCADLMELSRPGMYPARVKKKAWGSILLLISAGNTRKVIDHILTWRHTDIKLFLVDLLKVSPRGWLFATLGDPNPIAKHARHLQDPASGLPIQLVYFLFALLDRSARHKEEPNPLPTPQASVLSLASLVSASGKLNVGPGAFLRNFDIYTGHTAIASVVKYCMCARLNRISTMLRTNSGFSYPEKRHINLHSEVLEIYRLFIRDRIVQRQTKELLFISITRFHSVSLVHTLASWSPEFLRLFIILVMRWTLAFVKPTLSMDDPTLPKAYRYHLVIHPKGQHPVLPFLYFFTHLALKNRLAAEILIELNMISILKTMCINNYPNPAASASSPRGGIAISDVCAMSIMLIGALSTHPKACNHLLRLRNFPRWFLSFYYNSEFLGIPDAPLLQGIWIDLEKPLLKFVLGCVEYVLKDDILLATPQEADYLPLEHIYRDIISILSDPSSHPEMKQSAADSLFRCIVLKGGFLDVLDATFANGRSEETIAVLRTAAQSLGLYFVLSYPPPTTPSSYHTNNSSIPPFPPPGTPLRRVKRYIQQLAHLYTDDLKIYTALVADLIGSQACNARYTLADRCFGSPQPSLSSRSSSDEDKSIVESFYTVRTSLSIG
ncbi:hypothetical protein BXZ70DRAFT_1053284 [Cristinia sonorae]|uniref:Uncharacterized protein n=1 Tax=Cristinia sonorae TaxID=1940300 RepID=A0A8K0XJY4_9AGAR|nr:hypothetical protein BXZ70DRAFT_1053284 [Cristinia sonorae]